MDGWYVVKDRHGPTGGGMKGVEGWCRAPGVRMYVLIAHMHMWCGEKSTRIVWSVNVKLWRESHIKV